jgi:putative DNA primase/helicase
MQPQRENIHERARGRWRAVLPSLGIATEFLTGRHCPCPICGGADRFRFDDRGGGGGYICGQCGAGTGVDLVMKVHRLPFIDAVKIIEPLLPDAAVIMPTAKIDTSSYANELWAGGKSLTGMDPASKYLRRRGIKIPEWPKLLRYSMSVTFKHKDGSKTRHAAMLSRFVSPDAKEFATQVTFLTDTGDKADLPECRLTFGKMPAGGAVRLMPSAATMGVAEGVETALSASLLNGVPVWATLTSGCLTKWEPPPAAQNIIIFGDNDPAHGGQAAAFALAHKLSVVNKLNCEVRIPGGGDLREHHGEDWNDILKHQAA